jgi:hypothetical protein
VAHPLYEVDAMQWSVLFIPIDIRSFYNKTSSQTIVFKKSSAMAISFFSMGKERDTFVDKVFF